MARDLLGHMLGQGESVVIFLSDNGVLHMI